MSNKWLKWAQEEKKGNKNDEIEKFIKWLKIFYKANEKEKNLILVKLHAKNEALYKFVNDVRELKPEHQEILYEQIRGNIQ